MNGAQPASGAEKAAWQRHASCRTERQEWFFPVEGEQREERAAREARARAVCKGCPVRQPCLDIALELEIAHGIWEASTSVTAASSAVGSLDPPDPPEELVSNLRPVTGAHQPDNRSGDRVMTVLRVRVQVADAPGALAGITAALAALQVDVAALDVLEVDGRSVVDEMLLRLPPGVSPQEVSDVLRVAGGDVLSSAPATSGGDPAVAAFDLARTVFSEPGDADAPGRALARVAYADVGAFVHTEEAMRFPLAQRALEQSVPAVGHAGPDAAPLALPSGWVLWVAPQLSDPDRLAVVGRRLNVRFAATEAARLRAFATMLEQLRRVSA